MVPMSFFYDFEPEGGFAKVITQTRLFCLKESLKDNELELDKKENIDRGHQLFKMLRRGIKQKNKKIIYLSKEFRTGLKQVIGRTCIWITVHYRVTLVFKPWEVKVKEIN